MTDELGPRLNRLLGRLDPEEWREAVFDYLDRTPEPNRLFDELANPWIRSTVAGCTRDA
jgi:hypothetical protein